MSDEANITIPSASDAAIAAPAPAAAGVEAPAAAGTAAAGDHHDGDSVSSGDSKTKISIDFKQAIMSINGHIASVPDLWAFGIMVVIGGQYFGWNEALQMGFGSFIIAAVLISFGYLTLSLSFSELTSCVPFGGTLHILLMLFGYFIFLILYFSYF